MFWFVIFTREHEVPHFNDSTELTIVHSRDRSGTYVQALTLILRQSQSYFKKAFKLPSLFSYGPLNSSNKLLETCDWALPILGNVCHKTELRCLYLYFRRPLKPCKNPGTAKTISKQVYTTSHSFCHPDALYIVKVAPQYACTSQVYFLVRIFPLLQKLCGACVLQGTHKQPFNFFVLPIF